MIIIPDDFDFDRKVHEKTDFETFVFDYQELMAQVQSDGNLIVYEIMLNTLINKLDPYMEDHHKEWLERIRNMCDPHNPDINYARMQQKELLISHILNDLGTQFTPRKKGYIKKGLSKLWELYPPWEDLEVDEESEVENEDKPA